MSGAVRFVARPPREVPELESFAGAPHPREMLSLVGQRAAEQAFLAAYAGGKLHHAWLIAGPEGIGKATFAYRAARFLLAEAEREGAGDALFGAGASETLEVAPGSRTAQLVANEAHPDLAVLSRRYDAKTKKFRQEISVEDARTALGLFEKTAAFGGWRVILVDAADDLNAASANALLKTLEEPPARAVFLIVAHQPARLLPTIRSRCRLLGLQPLAAKDIAALLTGFGHREVDPALIARAEGSVKRALRLAAPGLGGFLAAIDAALARLPERRPGEIDRLAEAVRGTGEGAEAFADLCRAVESWLAGLIRQRLAGERHARSVVALAEAWAKIGEDQARIEAYNLDRRAYVILLFDELAALASAAQG